MIAALIRWSARNVFLVGFASLFLTLAGLYAVSRVPLDAIPDLSDVQVIVYTEFPGQAPQVVEDQVTYPLTTAMLSVPKSRVVRGFSFFGVSFVYVIFEEGTDLYWARSRVLEYLSSAARRLPTGVAPSLGPDATGVGWVYQYVVRGAQKSLAELRTIQDWYIRYGIAKAEGVAEVAGVGGFVKQYSVVIDPRRLQALGIPLSKVREALRASNMDVGGRTVELAETEFAVRGRGYLRGLTDLEQIVVKNDRGVPVLLKDVARVELTPDERRGIAELNGEGDEVAKVNLAQGPATIRTENAQLAVYIYVDLRDRDLGGFVADAQRAVADQVKFPPGTYVIWSGQFEYLQRAKARLQIVVPLTALIIFLLLYLNFRRVAETLIVMLSVPFALAGGFWLMWWLGFNLSVAAAVGFIALAGVAAETGVVVLIYLDHAYRGLRDRRLAEGASLTRGDLHDAVMAGAVERVRPKMMTVVAIMAGLLPIMWNHGTGAEVMQRIAVPMIGGMVSSTLLTLIVIPAIYAVVKGATIRKSVLVPSMQRL